jgi:uncharacterized membrane protein (UPF0127 family)
MRPISIHSMDGQAVADRAFATERWLERARGWLGKSQADPGDGLVLDPASSIHTFGMRFSLDLAFIDSHGKILKLYPDLKPNRVAFGPVLAWLDRQGMQALELPAGRLAALGIQVGQTLSTKDRVEGRRDA